MGSKVSIDKGFVKIKICVLLLHVALLVSSLVFPRPQSAWYIRCDQSDSVPMPPQAVISDIFRRVRVYPCIIFIKCIEIII